MKFKEKNPCYYNNKMSLPQEMINVIFYKFGGLKHPIASIVEDTLKEVKEDVYSIFEYNVEYEGYEGTFEEWWDHKRGDWLRTYYCAGCEKCPPVWIVPYRTQDDIDRWWREECSN